MRSSSIFPFNISKPFTSSGKTPRSSSTASLENNSGNDENFFTKKKRKKKKGLSSYIDNISVKFVVIQLSAFKRAHGSVTRINIPWAKLYSKSKPRVRIGLTNSRELDCMDM